MQLQVHIWASQALCRRWGVPLNKGFANTYLHVYTEDCMWRVKAVILLLLKAHLSEISVPGMSLAVSSSQNGSGLLVKSLVPEIVCSERTCSHGRLADTELHVNVLGG